MWHLKWLTGNKCGGCPQTHTCSDHAKAACPGHSPVVRPAARRTRLALETLEAREVFAANPIAAENALLGNPQSEWDVRGAGDPTLQGFATDISVDQGQTVSFKVDDQALAPYHIAIYRLGYYGGAGARKVATIPSSQTLRKVQPAPLTSAATKLVDAGNWSVTASWAVPATATSGVYLAKLVREDTGGASHIIFIVRDDDGRSDLLFQTSDATWQAYNNWGGNSTYDPTSTNGVRAYAVSYNRPLTIRGTSGGMGESNGLFWGEYPMIRWLEANGYNVSYSTDVDSDRRGAEILEHKAFLSVGHDEYWSAGQRTAVEAARDAGVNLAFFTGNEIYWKIRWENSIDASGTPYRTMVTYKESTIRPSGWSPPSGLPEGTQIAYVSGVEDPSAVWTGLWRDLRGADAKVEQELTGQIFSVNKGPGGMFGTAIKVPYEYSQMRLWRNTSITTLQPGQVATLASGTLGYEWDEDVDNGFRPAGTINMSETTEAVPEKLVDPISWPNCGGSLGALCATCKGCAVAPGTATHNLTQYKAESGALVFGAGTIQWAWGLDGVHDGGATTPDLRMQQATVNLFADMGVQAGTLRSGLVAATRSTDVTRPSSTVTSPTSGAKLTAGIPVSVTGTASDAGGGVVGGVEVSLDGGLTWRKATGRGNWSYLWTPTKTGPATIISRAADDSTNVELPVMGVPIEVKLAPTGTVGLVAAYDFNAGSGTTLADKAGTNNGTLSGPTWSAAGQFGGALAFDGVNDWVTIPDAAALDLTTAMTLEAWVRPTAAGNYGTTLFKEATGGDTYSLYAVDGTGKGPAVYGNLGAAGERSAKGPSALPLNTWSHLAATFDGARMSLYVNGSLAGTADATSPLITSTGALRLGGNSVYGDYFAGLIDDVRIYSRVLNVGEILTDMSTPVGGTIETTAPTATLTTAPATVSGTTTLTATATDNVAVAAVQFLVNGQPVGPELTAAPYTYAWDTTDVLNGSYPVTVRARDVAGNTATSAAATMTVANAADTTPPTVTLTGLTPNSTVGGKVTLGALASDNVGVVGVQFKANGANIGSEVTTAPYQILWDTAGLASGTYAITAVARDAAGNSTTSAAVSVVVDTTAPAVTATTPAAGATGVATSASPTVTFNESIQPGTLTFVIKDAAGNTLAATIQYNDATRTATLGPNASLTPSATYTVTVSGAKDLAGNAMAAPVSWSFTTENKITGATVWSNTTVPGTPAVQNDANPIEVGMKFQSAIAGSVVGVQFYKGAGNTGTHVAHLWNAAGALLASATFVNETGSGWQQVAFPTPVSIQANTTYVVSYYAPNGHYAHDPAYFTAAVASYPLTALSNGTPGGNGVYTYATGGGFPSDSYNAANYWVDVVFSSVVQDTAGPVVTAQTPASGSTAVAVNSLVTATFSEPVQASTVAFVLKDGAGNTVPSAVVYNDDTRTVTLTPTVALANLTTYTATVSGAKDAAGNTMAATTSWSFTTAGVVSGAASVWTNATVPATTEANDANPIEVGMKFRSDAAGYITGVRFYKGAGNTGTHVGHLWTGTGTLLGTATFTSETASGWQTVNFASPVAVQANTTYVVSYYAPNGRYAFNSGYFASSGVTAGNLTALSNAAGGGNGVYLYATGGGFPTGSYNASNYWVDAVFTTQAQDVAGPTVVAQSPASGATAVPITSQVTATFNEPVQATSFTFVLKDAAGNTVPANVTYDAAAMRATLAPISPLATNTTYTATLSGAKDTTGNVTGPTSWSFTTPTPVTSGSLFDDSATPAVLTTNDTNAVELGVRFYADVAGSIIGLRFYKGAGNTGTHVGHLWTNTGTLLATATFTGESASGWQTVTFGSPVAIQANTLYVASYYAPTGGYSATPSYFAGARLDSGFLHAPQDGANGGNGLFIYQAGGGFPTNSFNANNYWVDVVFQQSAADSTAPTVASVTPTAGSVGVLPSASLSVTFSEAVQQPTIAMTVQDSFGNLVAGNLSYDEATRTARFIPTAPLISFMTYTVTVSGVSDLNGNTLASPYSWTFKTRGIWLQTTANDFTSGTNNGTAVTNEAGGEVRLSPALADEFDGTGLSGTNWTSKSWASAGGGVSSITVASGVVKIGGTAILSQQSFVNTALEGRIGFGAAPYQHFGLATNFDTVAGNYWALFSTGGTTDILFARVNANGGTTDVSLGALPGGFHVYRVQPTGSGFDFYLDGILRTSIAASFQATVSLKAGLSAFNGSPALEADRVVYSGNTAGQSGTFVSTVFDAGQTVSWDVVNWTADLPAGTGIVVEVQTSADGSTWSGWGQVSSGGAISTTSSRYLRYRVTLTASTSGLSPVLRDISFTWK